MSFILRCVLFVWSASTNSGSLPSQCSSVITNTDFHRNIGYTGCSGSCYCESLSGWYRFSGAAGTKILSRPPSVGQCAAVYPAWFNGTLPTTVGGTSIGTGCVNLNGALCSTSYTIPIVLATNCNTFYAYYIPSSFSYCYVRFCIE